MSSLNQLLNQKSSGSARSHSESSYQSSAASGLIPKAGGKKGGGKNKGNTIEKSDNNDGGNNTEVSGRKGKEKGSKHDGTRAVRVPKITPFEEVLNSLPEETVRVKVIENHHNLHRLLSEINDIKQLRFRISEDTTLQVPVVLTAEDFGNLFIEDWFASHADTCMLNLFGRCESVKRCAQEHGNPDASPEFNNDINRLKNIIYGQYKTNFICFACMVVGGIDVHEARYRLPIFPIGVVPDEDPDAPNRIFCCKFCFMKHMERNHDQAMLMLDEILEEKANRPLVKELMTSAVFHNALIKQKNYRTFSNMFTPRASSNLRKANAEERSRYRAEVRFNSESSGKEKNKRMRNSTSDEEKGSPKKKNKDVPEVIYEGPSRSSGPSMLSSSEELKTAAAVKIEDTEESSSSSENESNGVESEKSEDYQQESRTNTDSRITESRDGTRDDNTLPLPPPKLTNVENNKRNQGDLVIPDAEVLELLPPTEAIFRITDPFLARQGFTEIGRIPDEFTAADGFICKPVYDESRSRYSDWSIGRVVADVTGLCLHNLSKRNGCSRRYETGKNRCSYDHSDGLQQKLTVMNLHKQLGFECSSCNSPGASTEALIWDSFHIKLYPGYSGHWSALCYNCAPSRKSLKGSNRSLDEIVSTPILRDLWRINAVQNSLYKTEAWAPFQDKYSRTVNKEYKVGYGSFGKGTGGRKDGKGLY